MRHRNSGFTLIELMVTIAVLAVIVTLAVPSFQDTINASRLTSAANEAAAIFQGARMEALRLNKTVVVCPSATPDSGVTCGSAGARGLVSYVAGSGTALRRMSLPANVSMQRSASFGDSVVFRPDGFAHAATGSMLNAVVAFCIPTNSPAENLRRVSIASGSRITTQRGSGNPCPETPADKLP